MDTYVLSVNKESLSKASNIIKEGGLVAFPTETVYGLGASALDENAVKRIFEAKGRPQDNPLIVHLSCVDELNVVSNEVTINAKKILKAFAPGPVTVVLKKSDAIPNVVTAGLDTVGIRIPSHIDAREFIKACGVPIAAPSANTSKRPSPTCAQDVFVDMNGKIPLILDGGNCDVGIESTVVDCRFDTPIILRAGKITSEDIKRVCGSCDMAGENSEVRAPGMKYKHYAPLCKMFVKFKDKTNLKEIVNKFQSEGENVVLLGNSDVKNITNNFLLLGDTVDEYMHNYFTYLRKAEKMGTCIVCFIPFDEKEAEGLYNRANKSCGGNIL